MKKILNVILPIALLALVYGFIREMYFVQKVYQEEYVTRFTLFSGLLTLVFVLLVLLIGYGYSKTDRVRILDGIFGVLPSIILLIPVVCYFLMTAMSGSVGGWITNFLNWTTLSMGGTPMANVITDHWQAFALAGLALLFGVIFRKRRQKAAEEEEEDYLDDLPPVNEKPAKKPAKKPRPKEEAPAEVKPEPVEEPDPIYAEPEPEAAPEAPQAVETPDVIEMPAPEEAPAPEMPETPEVPEAPEMPEAPAPEKTEAPEL